MTTLLITGATRGLGLATARAAAALEPDVRILVAGRDRERTAAAAREAGGEPVLVDLSSLDAVRRAAEELPAADLLALNAGLQVPGELRTTVDGFEETFQVNHLAQLLLVDLLVARGDALRRIVLVGSATHDPAQFTGMPAPFEADVATIAAGGPAGASQAGRRRYTTSKLLSTAATGALAREHPERYVGCLDPGLITGTGLARDYPAPMRALYTRLERPIALLPFASTQERSGTAFARLLLDEPPPVPSGTVADHRLRAARISTRAADPAFQDAVLADSRALLHGAALPA